MCENHWVNDFDKSMDSHSGGSRSYTHRQLLSFVQEHTLHCQVLWDWGRCSRFFSALAEAMQQQKQGEALFSAYHREIVFGVVFP